MVKFNSILKLGKAGFTNIDEYKNALRVMGESGESSDLFKRIVDRAHLKLKNSKLNINGVPLNKIENYLKRGDLHKFLKTVDPSFFKLPKAVERYEQLLQYFKPSYPKMKLAEKSFQRNLAIDKRLNVSQDEATNALKSGERGIEELAKRNPTFMDHVKKLKDYIKLKPLIYGGLFAAGGYNIYKYLYDYAVANSGCYKDYYDEKKKCKIRELSCCGQETYFSKKLRFCPKQPKLRDACLDWNNKSSDCCNNKCNALFIETKSDETDDKTGKEDNEARKGTDNKDDDTGDYYCEEMSMRDAFYEVLDKADLTKLLFDQNFKNVLLSLAAGTLVTMLSYYILSKYVDSYPILISGCVGIGVFTFFLTSYLT